MGLWAVVVAALVGWIASVAREGRADHRDAQDRQLLLLGGLIAQQHPTQEVAWSPPLAEAPALSVTHASGVARVRVLDPQTGEARAAQSIRWEDNRPVVRWGD